MTSPAISAAVERRTELRADPGRVWRALTEPDELRAWFGQGAELDLRAGGRGCFEWDGHGGYDILVEVVEPPTYLAWRWASERDRPIDEVPSTLVEFRLVARADGGTSLSVRESGFVRPESRDQNDEGWAEELGELVEFVDGEPWRAGITRRLDLRADPETVWRAFGTLDGWSSWWGPLEGFEARVGVGGLVRLASARRSFRRPDRAARSCRAQVRLALGHDPGSPALGGLGLAPDRVGGRARCRRRHHPSPPRDRLQRSRRLGSQPDRLVRR